MSRIHPTRKCWPAIVAAALLTALVLCLMLCLVLWASPSTAQTYRLLISTGQGQLRSVILDQNGQGATIAQALDDARAKSLEQARKLLEAQIEARKLDIKLSFFGADHENGAASFVFVRSYTRLPADGQRLVKAVTEVVYLLTPSEPPEPSAVETLPPIPSLPMTPPHAGNSTLDPLAIRENQKEQYQELERSLQNKLQEMLLDSP